MKVTIIVPIKDFVEPDCYASLLNQTYKDRAILIHQMNVQYLNEDPQKNKTCNSALNRNEMRKAALGTKSTHFLMVDSDTVLPDNALESLLSRKKDIVCGWSPIVGENNWIAGRIEGGKFTHIKPEEGVVEVDMCPLGCMLVKRKVLEDIHFDPAVNESIVDDRGSGYAYMGITLKFAQNAQAKGYKLFMDGDIICKHKQKQKHVKKSFSSKRR